MIVLRRPAPRSSARLSVGKRVGPWVYELCVTNVPATRLLAQDVLDVYRGRGGFENSFAAEDQETDPDRWCSQGRTAGRSWLNGSGICVRPWVNVWASQPHDPWNGLLLPRFLRRSNWRSANRLPLVPGNWPLRPAGPLASGGMLTPLLCSLMARCVAHRVNFWHRNHSSRKRRFASARSGRPRPSRVPQVHCVSRVWVTRPKPPRLAP